MWEDDVQLCWLLADSMINAVGFLPVQRLNRRVDDILSDIHHFGSDVEVILTGSWSEGFRMNGTDVDRMYVDRKVLASESPENIPSRFCAVKMEKSPSIPKGFVKLELLTPNKSGQHIDVSLRPEGGKLYISSQSYVLSFMQDGGETHGPCIRRVSRQNGTEQDDAHCLKCGHWPSDAMEWYTRPRHHEWPDRNLVKEIYKKGCHVVPIGSKIIDQFGQWSVDHMLWRLSFSVAEKWLVYTFNDTQFLVYGIFKLLVKEAFQDPFDVLCSYFMKTLMFWCIEETPRDCWKQERLISCIDLCFRRLIEWVSNGFCPNFFVRENNMFHGKLNDIGQEYLFESLTQLYGEGWRGLLICPSLENLRNALQGARTRILTTPDIGIDINEEFKTLSSQRRNDSSTFTEDLEDNAFFSQIESIVNCSPTFSSLEKEFFNTVAMLLGKEAQFDVLIQDTVTLYQHRILQHIGLIFLYKGLNDNRRCARFRYRHIKRALGLLEMSSSGDISRGRLSLATSLYIMGYFSKALKTIRQYEECLENVQGVLYVSSRYPNRTDDAYIDNFCNNNLTRVEKASMGVSYDFEVFRAMPIFPKEVGLEILLEHNRTARVCFPPRPYAVFLKALCFAQRQDFGNVSVLRSELSDMFKGSPESAHSLIHVMLAVCDTKLDQPGEALEHYYHAYWLKLRRSWGKIHCSERDSDNSPLWYVALMLRLLM